MGTDAAKQLIELGVSEITRHGNASTIGLRKPVPIGDKSGQVKLGEEESLSPSQNQSQSRAPQGKDAPTYYVSFTSAIYGGSASLEDVKGVVASNSLGSAEVTRIDLQPRKQGNTSATLHTSWLDVNICAFADSKIVH